MFTDWEAGSGCTQVLMNDEHCHGPDEHVLTGRRKSECGGRLCFCQLLPLSQGEWVVIARPEQTRCVLSPMLGHITHRQQVLFSRPWFSPSVEIWLMGDAFLLLVDE